MVQIGFIGFLTSFLYLLDSLSVLQLSFYYFVAISIPFILAAVFYLIGWKNISKNLPEGSTLKPPRLKDQFIILFGTSLYSLVTIIVSVFLVWFVRFKKQEVGKEIQNQAFISSQNLKRVLDKMENETALLSLTYSSLLSGRTSFDRSASRSLLRDYLLDSAYWEGVWVLFEPNAFDGKDASSKMSQSMKAISSTTSDFVSQAQNQASSVEEATAALEENSASLEHIHENKVLEETQKLETMLEFFRI